MERLRDGSLIEDTRLNRIIQFDERSRMFSIEEKVSGKEPGKNNTWRMTAQVLDQGSEGACVGFGISHELAAYPAEVAGISNEFAYALYKDAQKIDPWPGEDYSGTSVLAGIKVAQSMAYFDEYRWAFNFTDILLGLSYNGPAVFGTYWWEDMYKPTKCCHSIYPKGRIVGGHCYLGVGVDWNKERIQILNSWGSDWGDNGRAFISFADMETIIKNKGECAFFTKRHIKPANIERG